jgi:hypothetical protein
MSSVEQTRAIEAIRNLGNLEARFAPILRTTNVLISQRQATRESLERLGIAAQRVLDGFKLSKQGLTGIIQQINDAVASVDQQQNGQLTNLTQRLEEAVAGSDNSEDAINLLIEGINELIREIDQEIPPPSAPSGPRPANARTQLMPQENRLFPPPPSSQPPPSPPSPPPSPQIGGFVWRTPPKTPKTPKTPNTPRLTLNKTPNPVRNNGLIRTKTRKTRTKTKKSNPKTIISRRTRSKSRS